MLLFVFFTFKISFIKKKKKTVSITSITKLLTSIEIDRERVSSSQNERTLGRWERTRNQEFCRAEEVSKNKGTS